MLRAIESAGPEVLILKPGPGVSNTCVQSSQTEQACNDACYREVLNSNSLEHRIRELINKRVIEVGHPAAQKFSKFYGKDTTYSTEVRRCKIPLAHKPKDGGPRGVDRILQDRINTFDEKNKIEEGINLVRYLQNGLAGYHVMDHLTPGPGTGAWVVWDPSLEDVGAQLPLNKRADWMVRPPWIALAHELIHAWRLVRGCCVFRPSPLTEYYYEEAMTVGLPPYDRCRFTENRFRSAKGLPLRTFYGEETRAQTLRAATKHGAVGSRLQIEVIGSGPKDPLVFDFEIRSASKPDNVVSGTTGSSGHATVQGVSDGEIRFRGFGALGRVETQWQKIVFNRSLALQFGRYQFICRRL
jgi:hypothetical protein